MPYNFQVRQIQRIGFAEGDAEDALEGVFDGLAAVDGNRVIERGNDLDGHPGFNLNAVANLSAFGCDCKQSHERLFAF